MTPTPNSRFQCPARTVTKQQGLMGLQEHDLIMADEEFSGKTVKNPYSRACWTKWLGQVGKYHLKIQKMQK